MTKTVLSALLLAALAACSGDICSQQRSLSQEQQSKLSACFAGDAGFLGATAYTSCDQSACEAALPSCTAADQQAIQKQLNCTQNAVNQLTSDCSLPSVEAYGAALTACALDGGVPNISTACAQAIATQTSQNCH